QAEDGIRDFHVTGVQTCALPILHHSARLPARMLSRLPGLGARDDGARTHLACLWEHDLEYGVTRVARVTDLRSWHRQQPAVWRRAHCGYLRSTDFRARVDTTFLGSCRTSHL